jgi:hypothetical protein
MEVGTFDLAPSKTSKPEGRRTSPASACAAITIGFPGLFIHIVVMTGFSEKVALQELRGGL